MNLHPIILELLNKRGYSTEKDVSEFLSSKPRKTYDPFLLHNMAEGVDLVLSAVENDERICVYGDYDADGVTATSVLLEFLSHLTPNLSYYIPSRFDEGYGLNKTAMEKISAAGVGLVVTVDCGSVSREEVEYGKKLGLEIVVTDHHQAELETLPACPVINPNQPDCTYPFKGLAGCGVAFKLAQAIGKTIDLPPSTYNDTLDLVAVGTIADVMPLVDENRTLVKYGLLRLNSGSRLALRELTTGIGLKLGEVRAFNVSFGIAPHINAAGRIKAARLGVKLFRSQDEDEIKEIIDIVKECNSMRKDLQNQTFLKCVDKVEGSIKENGRLDNFLLIQLDDVHEGVTGIAAGKVKDKYYRPVAVVTPTDDGKYKGTGRSIEGIDLHRFLSNFSNLFERFGGHKAACGFTIAGDNLTAFREGIAEKMEELISEQPDLFTRTWTWDFEAAPEDLTVELAYELNLFEPCGKGNETPVFAVNGFINRLTSMGREGQYRRFLLNDDNGRSSLQCVSFALEGGSMDELREGMKVKAIGSLNLNSWNGRVTAQFNVRKIFPAECLTLR